MRRVNDKPMSTHHLIGNLGAERAVAGSQTSLPCDVAFDVEGTSSGCWSLPAERVGGFPAGTAGLLTWSTKSSLLLLGSRALCSQRSGRQALCTSSQTLGMLRTCWCVWTWAHTKHIQEACHIYLTCGIHSHNWRIYRPQCMHSVCDCILGI